MHKLNRVVIGVIGVGGISGAVAAAPRVIITEIMYNPASPEGRGETEWVEIVNVGAEAIEITNWRLDDEDDKPFDDWGPFSVSMPRGAIVVLVNDAAVNDQTFREAWDDLSEGSLPPGYVVVPIKWGNLSNTASTDNEILRLLNDQDEVVCEVNFESGSNGWPTIEGKGGPSIYLTDPAATNLSDGKLWRASEPGIAGARANRKTEIFKGDDIGSPGYFAGRFSGGMTPPGPSDNDKSESSGKTEPQKHDNTIPY